MYFPDEEEITVVAIFNSATEREKKLFSNGDDVLYIGTLMQAQEDAISSLKDDHEELKEETDVVEEAEEEQDEMKGEEIQEIYEMWIGEPVERSPHRVRRLIRRSPSPPFRKRSSQPHYRGWLGKCERPKESTGLSSSDDDSPKNPPSE